MRFHREALRVDDAQRTILRHVREMNTECVALRDCAGRTLARTATADHDMPHFRRSGLDGFAVRSEDTATASEDNPVWLEVIGNIPCGTVLFGTVAERQAARIMTGAAVPDGADAIVRLEETETASRGDREYVAVKKRIAPGEHVTPVGFELRRGSVIVERGRRINAGGISLLASHGYAEAEVFRRPRTAIFSTGNELLPVGSALQPGKIRNSNSPMIAELIRQAGGDPVIIGTLPDEIDVVSRAVTEALRHFDLVVTTGGVSVGDYDVMAQLFEQWEGRLLFNKVAMRPGSPTSAGVLDGKLLIALSGNPSACYVGCVLFVRPAIRAMLADPDPLPGRVDAFFSGSFSKKGSYARYLLGRFSVSLGRLYAEPLHIIQSSAMVSIQDADCLIEIPPESPALQAGDLVKAIPLHSPAIVL